LQDLPNFYLFVDEFQSFANESFADILSEARKYKLNLTIAHQYIEQMPEEVRNAVFGNVGTMITFRVGAYDAEVLEKEFAPQFVAQDLVNLGKFQTYMRLMIDGISSQPFSAATLPPLELPEDSYVDEIIEASRKQFSKSRSEVEAEIKTATEMGKETNNEKKERLDEKQRRKDQSKQARSENKKGKPVINKNSLKDIKAVLDTKKDIKSKDIPEAEASLEEEGLSLKKLKPQKRVEDTKKVTPENKNSLKDALAAALGNNVIDNGQPKKEEKKPVQDSNSKKEIPEMELKKMLEVEK
jgi:hypothetical protein